MIQKLELDFKRRRIPASKTKFSYQLIFGVCLSHLSSRPADMSNVPVSTGREFDLKQRSMTSSPESRGFAHGILSRTE